MLNEHDQVVLTADLLEHSLVAGDAGTIVYIHQGGEAYVIEFFTLDGDTAAIATALPEQLRATTSRDILHARTVSAAT